ncbi:MAG: hypothetical protein OEZ58_10345 [Gammaproteobacteria bacterium]|nr:hypothetical protein [Gammaproteobacteria bacterium]
METFDTSEIRKYTKMMAPTADFDSSYTFYYDETNNIRKFYVNEFDFNSAFTENFVLGGLVHKGSAPEVQHLIDSFKLQSTAKEVKFKHIAKGNFLDCLNSQKLYLFLKFIKNSNLYIHYSSLNLLYWSIVDIVDSAIVNSEASQKLGPQFANKLKNDLYKLSRLEIDPIISLFHSFKYPNIKKESILPFIEALSDLFESYIDDIEFHFGLESLRQLLKVAKKEGSLPFIMDGEDFILIKDFSQSYLRPIYLFKNATHIFDSEDSISRIVKNYKILDGTSEIKNYSFVDSQTNRLIQLSDVFVGLIGKLSGYLNTSSRDKINSDFGSITSIQGENINLLLGLIDKSHDKNIGFLHTLDSEEERSKIVVIREKML